MNTSNKQSGFTLIELIVVMVILGILAATALPKFANLGQDARIASVSAASGSLSAAAAMAHGKYLAAATNPSSAVIEGVTVNFSNGYPDALTVAAAAGLSSSDYGTDTSTASQVAVYPLSASASTTCKVVYAEAATSVAAPTYTSTTSGC